MSAFDNLVNAARDFACGLYKQQPAALIPNIGDSVLRFAWDKLCDYPNNPGLPPPPASPFNGGQCVCVGYRVNFTYFFEGMSAPEPTGLDVYGPVLEVGFHVYPNGTSGIGAFCRGRSPLGCLENFRWVDAVGFGGDRSGQITVSNIEVFRLDGQVDNCGNLPESYPPAPPVPPDGYTSPPTPIPLADGDNITVNFNFTPPAAPLDKIPPITINYIQPELNVNLKVPIEFNFNGEINIGAPSSPPVALPPEVYTELEEINNNVNNIELEFNDYRKDYDFFFSPPQLDNDPETIKEDDFIEDGKEEDKQGIVGLRIELTKLPDKAQFGSPTVYFAGWMAFKREQGYMPREQINFANSFFLAPPGCTGYTVTFTNGAEGNIRVYSRENEG
jgi:hypothetical protein